MTKTIHLQSIFSRQLTRATCWLFLMTLLVTASFGAALGDVNRANPPAPPATAKREIEKHLSKAEFHENQAIKYESEIEQRWKKYATEQGKIAVIPKMVGENPYVRRLRLQTERDVAELKRLAAEAEDAARYHRLRARELADE